MLHIDRLDHLVLTVRNIEETSAFYVRTLGMEIVTFGAGRTALVYGTGIKQKINLHQYGSEFEPKAHLPTPGSADFCFITSTPIADVLVHLEECRVAIVDGPIERTGASGVLLSIYIRDPDGSLIEVSNYI